MFCAEFEILLSDYVDETLTAEQRLALEQHTETCGACRQLLQDVGQAVSFIERVEPVEPPPDLITRIVYHAPGGRLRDPHEPRGFISRWFGSLVQTTLQLGTEVD